MERLEKKIEMSLINKIKHLQVKMMEYGDDENYRGISACERAIDHYISKYPKEWQYEIKGAIYWVNNECKARLERLGWKVIIGE